MAKSERITRRQKDISRMLRERMTRRPEQLKIEKRRPSQGKPFEISVDLQDKKLMRVICEGKKIIARETRGIPVEKSFKKIRNLRKA